MKEVCRFYATVVDGRRNRKLCCHARRVNATGQMDRLAQALWETGERCTELSRLLSSESDKLMLPFWWDPEPPGWAPSLPLEV